MTPKEIAPTTQVEQWQWEPIVIFCQKADSQAKRQNGQDHENVFEVLGCQGGKTMAEYDLISRRMPPAGGTERAARRKTFSLAVGAALLLLAIGNSACLYIPPIPEDPTPTPGWNENKSQLQENGIHLQQSAENHSVSTSEVANSVAAKSLPNTH